MLDAYDQDRSTQERWSSSDEYGKSACNFANWYPYDSSDSARLQNPCIASTSHVGPG